MLTHEELQRRYEELNECAKRLNIYLFDFNHTLEEGSEIAITHAINSARRDNGYTEVDVDQILELYGHPLGVFAQQFCPWVTDVDSFVVELSKDIFESARKFRYMKPSEGAVEVLRTLKARGDLIVVLSAIRESLYPYLELLGMQEYVHANPFFGYWSDVRQHLDSFPLPGYMRSFLEQEQSDAVEYFKAYVAYLYGRHSSIDYNSNNEPIKFSRRFLIGDSEVDMRAVVLANGLIEKEREHSARFGVYSSKPRIESVFYNPKGTTITIRPDHEIKHLQELLSI